MENGVILQQQTHYTLDHFSYKKPNQDVNIMNSDSWLHVYSSTMCL